MISRDMYCHILKISGKFLNFWLIYKNVFLLGDHDHVRLDQVRVSFLSDHKVPLCSYAESFRSISLFLANICEFQSKRLTGRVVVVVVGGE